MSEDSIRLHASSLNTLEHIAIFHKDFCVDIDIVVFKVEVVCFSKHGSFWSKMQLSQTRNKNSKEKSDLGPKRPKVVSLLRFFI